MSNEDECAIDPQRDNGDEPTCALCWGSDETEKLTKPCNCPNFLVHESCLQDWLRANPTANACVICKAKYKQPLLRRATGFIRYFAGLFAFFVAGFCAIASVFAHFLFVLATLARPVGFLLWILWSLFVANPSNSPMFLFMLKMREMRNDVELDIDSALGLQQHARAMQDFYSNNIYPPMPDILIFRLTTHGHLRCEDWLHFAKYEAKNPSKWVFIELNSFLNATCGIHPEFGHQPALRFCKCNSDQSELAEQLRRSILSSLYRLNCRYFHLLTRKRGKDDLYYDVTERTFVGEFSFKIDSFRTLSLWLLAHFDHAFFWRLSPIQPMLSKLLPYAIKKYEADLTYAKFTPRLVDGKERLNPRFYGFPLGSSKGLIITDLTLNFFIIFSGITIELALIYHAQLCASLVKVFKLMISIAHTTLVFGFHSTSLVDWVSQTLLGLKAVLLQFVAKWVPFVVLAYYVLKEEWLESSFYEKFLASMIVLVSLFGCLYLYGYWHMMVSQIVLRTFDLDVFHYYGG